MNDFLKKERIKFIVVCIALAAASLLAAVLSLCVGSMDISIHDICTVILQKITNAESTIAPNITAVVWDIRLPRIICGFFIGAGLAVSGVIFQGILQNPLADPYTIGISTGASFGASLAIVLSLYTDLYFPPSAAAMIFALVTLVLVLAVSSRGSSLKSSNLVISGIIISSVFSSGISFVKMLAGENVGAVVFWIMGSLSAMDWSDAAVVMPCVTVCILLSMLFSRQLDIMSLGDENARSLGINTDRLRLVYLLIGSAATAACVSVCGVIGFVGLIVPHLLRFWLTPQNKMLIPLSALAGGLLLMLADNITRVISTGEIPVGVITTLLGGPFFIFIFTRRTGREA